MPGGRHCCRWLWNAATRVGFKGEVAYRLAQRAAQVGLDMGFGWVRAVPQQQQVLTCFSLQSTQECSLLRNVFCLEWEQEV